MNDKITLINDHYPSIITVDGAILTAADDGGSSFELPINNLTYDIARPAALDARQGKVLQDTKAPKANPIFTGTVKLHQYR